MTLTLNSGATGTDLILYCQYPECRGATLASWTARRETRRRQVPLPVTAQRSILMPMAQRTRGNDHVYAHGSHTGTTAP